MDIHSICRICLEYIQNGNSYDLFLVPGLAKKLCMCTSLWVEPQDGFPNNICGVCYTRLSEMAEFQKLCVDSVQKFQELLANNRIVRAPTFDIMEAPATAPIEGVQMPEDEDENLNFEMLENEEDVFKMLETVDKEEIEDVSPKVEDDIASEDSSDNDRDSDEEFQFINMGDNGNDDSDSDDDKPLAETEMKDPNVKPKRKRIPAAERHLHRIIECHICHQKFKKTKNYEEHMKYHNDKLPFQCEVENCKRGFTTAYGLRLHVEHCHDETVEKIPCTQEGCDMMFTRRRILNWHLKRVHKMAKEDVPKSYPCNECEKDATSTEKCHRENKLHSSPTSSRRKSPVRSRYNEKPSQYRVYNAQTDRYKRRDRTKSPSPSRLKKKPPEKLPYYRDEVRERDRLRRLYGYSRSRSPDPSAGKKGSPIRKRRAETPPRRRSTSRERHSRHSTSRERHSRRSTSKERHIRRSPFRSLRRNYRNRRSRTPSRISESHEHPKHTDKNLGNGHNLDSNSVANTVIPVTPQYIPIPVAVPADYAAYSFPGWPSPQPPWHPAHRPPPPSHFSPFPIWPMMHQMRPPHQTAFIGIQPTLPYTPLTAQYRPHASQRYPSQRHNMNNYQARPKKSSS